MNLNPAMDVPPALRPYARQVWLPDGTRLHYYEAGSADAPVLILIHGLGDEADSWRHVLLPLAEHWRVIAPDLPGFGRSSQPNRAYTLVYFARTLAAMCAALQVQRATLAGSSLGAAVAQRLALAAPHLVERLILVGGNLPLQPTWPPAQLWWFLAPGVGEAIYTRLRQSQEGAYRTLEAYYYQLDQLPAEDQAFLRERVWARVWSSGQRRAFLSALRWLSIERVLRASTFRAALRHHTVPTLFLWGEHDQINARDDAEELVAALPRAHLALIPDAGHLPQQERPAELVALIRNWFTTQ